MIRQRRTPPGRAISRLRAEGATPDAIDRLLRDNAVPLTEGTFSTFLWRGQADAVAVEHRVVDLPQPLVLQRLGATDLWHATVELPQGSRMQYRMLVRRGGDIETVLDPLNPRHAEDPFSSQSVLETAGYETPGWAIPDPAVVPGELVEARVPSRHLQRDVTLTLYLPMRMRRRDRLPLLVVHDGDDFLRYAGMATVLDNLMHRRLMADTVVAFVPPLDRNTEYIASPRHSRFLTGELVPRLERSLPLRGDPAGRFLAGASLGAIATLAAASRAPGFYGGLLLQSATFLYSVVRRPEPDRMLGSVVTFVNGLRAAPRPVTDRIFLSIGALEVSADRNRAMVATLERMAAAVRVEEGLDGHNWISWRDRMLGALGWLLPGDARLVYS